MPLTFERNHEPHQQGVWFDYTGFRFKDYYDIALHDGTVHTDYRPNGDGWHGKRGRIDDSEVAKVRLKPDGELSSKYCYTGKARIDHQIMLFGEA